MQTIEHRTINKSTWGEGPWQHEPDKKQWQDPATGYPCLIVRNGGGALCGYVGVPKGHSCHGVDYDAAYEVIPSLEVHGGLTFAGPCQPRADESHGICHTPDPGEPDDVWWLGFDCSHYQDLSPAYQTELRRLGVIKPESVLHDNDVYRDLEYVTGQVTELAAQLYPKLLPA